MSPPRRAIALDLDGTLLDLPVEIDGARAEVAGLLAAAGYPGPASPILAAIAAAAAAHGEGVRAQAYAALDRAEVAAAARATARPGAAALLAGLARRGTPVAIVTDNGRACVAAALEAAGLPAPAVLVTRDDVGPTKPAPDGLVAAARRVLPDGGALLWAGDSPRDVAAGRAARAKLPGVTLTVVAVAGPRGPSLELAAAGPDRQVDDLEALAALVGG
jgi:sugar-phosphatase